jgi:predicted nucleic acid-binding protein
MLFGDGPETGKKMNGMAGKGFSGFRNPVNPVILSKPSIEVLQRSRGWETVKRLWLSARTNPYLRRSDLHLAESLQAGRVVVHPFVVGEIACGNLANRSRVLSLLEALPVAKTATQEEVLSLIEQRSLYGKGLGWMDVHLLASALLSRLPLWTRDRNLHKAAMRLRVAYKH